MTVEMEGQLLARELESPKPNLVDKKAIACDWETPPRILGPVETYCDGRIGLDPATTSKNPTNAIAFFTPESDGLAREWGGYGTVFVNPPYGRKIKDWMAKIGWEARRGVPILALISAGRWEQGYFHTMIEVADAACFVRKRVAFIRPETGKPGKANTYPSILWGFNVDGVRFATAFDGLGLVVAIHTGRRGFPWAK